MPSTAEQVLFPLKTRGPQTTRLLAAAPALTSIGARRQLEAWLDKGGVRFEDAAHGPTGGQHDGAADKVGRSARQWLLTGAGHARFPDRHADLTLQLLTRCARCSASPAWSA